MERLLIWIGRIAALAGMVISAVAIVSRLLGAFSVGGLWNATLLQIGMAGMLAGCAIMLTVITMRR